MNNKINTKTIALVGVMTAAVFASSSLLQIPIPTPLGLTRLHMGNVFCLVAGMLLGPVTGGFAAGFGSMLFDLTNPIFIASAPFTFIFKFAMAFVCGLISWSNGSKAFSRNKNIVGGIIGSGLYVILYLSKEYLEQRFVFGFPNSAILVALSQKAIISSINAVIAVIVAVILVKLLNKKVNG